MSWTDDIRCWGISFNLTNDLPGGVAIRPAPFLNRPSGPEAMIATFLR